MRAQNKLSFSLLSGAMELYYDVEATTKYTIEIQYVRPTSSCAQFLFIQQQHTYICMHAKIHTYTRPHTSSCYFKITEEMERFSSTPHIYLCYARKYNINYDAHLTLNIHPTVCRYRYFYLCACTAIPFPAVHYFSQ